MAAGGRRLPHRVAAVAAAESKSRQGQRPPEEFFDRAVRCLACCSTPIPLPGTPHQQPTPETTPGDDEAAVVVVVVAVAGGSWPSLPVTRDYQRDPANHAAQKIFIKNLSGILIEHYKVATIFFSFRKMLVQRITY